MFTNDKRGGLSRSGGARGPGAPAIAMSIGKASDVGKGAPALSAVGNAPKPMRSRRDYGKTAPAAGSAPQPSPFGPTIPGGL